MDMIINTLYREPKSGLSKNRKKAIAECDHYIKQLTEALDRDIKDRTDEDGRVHDDGDDWTFEVMNELLPEFKRHKEYMLYENATML